MSEDKIRVYKEHISPETGMSTDYVNDLGGLRVLFEVKPDAAYKILRERGRAIRTYRILPTNRVPGCNN